MADNGLLASTRDVILETPVKAAFYLFLAVFAYNTVVWIFTAVYNLYFHPLRDIPGPWPAAVSDLYKNYFLLKGRLVYQETQWHRKYGPVVRNGPNSVHFTDPQAWKDIYGHRTGGRPATTKTVAVEPAHKGHEMLEFIPSEEEHGRRRRLYAHAFSDSAIRQQEPILHDHVNKLVTQLKIKSEESPDKPQDIVQWLHFCTFDIMGDLAFGHGMGLTETATYNPWVAAIVGSFKAFSRSYLFSQYEPFRSLVKYTYLGTIIKKAIAEHRRFAQLRVDERLDSKVDRPDIWGLVMKAEPDRLPSRWAMHEDGMLFMQAGTDTTSTLLCGLLYWLLKTPETLKLLEKEVRSEIKGPGDDITLERLARLPYVAACIEEGLRIHPPAPVGFLRHAPKGGIAVCGRFFKEGTGLAVPQYGAFHYPGNFALPDEFHPERWIGADPRFVNDKKDALQPFLYGPRNCIGKNLAYSEMRLILASLIFNFDIELDDKSKDWMPHEVHGLWTKPPLFIKFKPRF